MIIILDDVHCVAALSLLLITDLIYSNLTLVHEYIDTSCEQWFHLQIIVEFNSEFVKLLRQYHSIVMSGVVLANW